MGDHTTSRETTATPTIGLICNPDHSVFVEVADRLERVGVSVRFFEPGRLLGEDELSDLSLLMNKKVDPASLYALFWADQHGISTWNGYETILLGIRLVGYQMLEFAGFQVPTVHREKPDVEYVAKTFADWHFEPDPERNGEGDIYQELVPATPFDYKYYAVDTGGEITVQVLQTTSKLLGDKQPLGLVDPDPKLAENVRRLMRLTDSQALGVDVVEVDGEFWAVDVNPAMSFRHADMEDYLAASALARLDASVELPSFEVERLVQGTAEL